MTVGGIGQNTPCTILRTFFKYSLNRFTNDTIISPILQQFTCAYKFELIVRVLEKKTFLLFNVHISLFI